MVRQGMGTNKSLAWKGKGLIGVVHLQPLPGSPRYRGSMREVCSAAVADAQAYEEGGAQGLMIENFGDLPFTRGVVAPETVAAMAVVAESIRATGVELPCGFNVLRNDVSSAMALAASCGGAFVRVNVHTGAVEADQGIIQGEAYTGSGRHFVRRSRSGQTSWSSMPFQSGILESRRPPGIRSIEGWQMP